jgi:hypothetical protein
MESLQMKKCIFLFLTLIISSCSSVTWESDIGPSEGAVDAMLDTAFFEGETWDYDLKKNKDFKLPQTMRPCCAFGTNHKVQFGALPIPLIRMSNTISFEEIGAHSYDASAFTRSSFRKTKRNSTENNGLIYTEKGGMLDTAHIRDTADLTVALFYYFYENIGKTTTVELRRELGKATMKLKAFDASKFSNKERWLLASALAARKAYQMAVAHEIAQWHGYRSFELFSEEVSAYSPEDLYSNLLGAKVASTVINNKLALSSESFNKHMTIWLEKTIQALEPASKYETNELLMTVDGTWWDSDRRLPSKELVIKRNYNTSDVQTPLLIASNKTKLQPKTIKLTKYLYGIDLDKLAYYSFEVDVRYRKKFSHIPEKIWKDGIDTYDFQRIADYDEIEDKKFFRRLREKR